VAPVLKGERAWGDQRNLKCYKWTRGNMFDPKKWFVHAAQKITIYHEQIFCLLANPTVGSLVDVLYSCGVMAGYLLCRVMQACLDTDVPDVCSGTSTYVDV